MRETATSTELRRQALAQAYVSTKGNVREAAEMAGYAYSSALQVLREPEFESRYLDPARRAILAPGLQAAQITAQRVMLELGRVAFSDIRKLYTPEGELKPVHQLDDDAAAAVSGINVEVVARGRGEEAEPVLIKKIKVADKMAALGILARHFKLVGDEGDGVNALASALADRLKSARRRIGDPEPVEEVNYRDIPQQPPADDFPDDLT